MRGRSSKKRRWEEAMVKDKNTGIRQMQRHIKVKKCADFEYEDSKERIFKIRVNSASKTNRMSSKGMKNKEDDNVVSSYQGRPSRTISAMSKCGKLENQIPVDAIQDLNCSNTRVTEHKLKETKYCKIKKVPLTNKTSSRGKRYLKRKKNIDNEKNEDGDRRLKSDKHVNESGSENEKGVNSESIKDNEDNTCNLENSSVGSELPTSGEEDFTCDVCNRILIGRVQFEQHRMLHKLSKLSKKPKIHKCSYEGCVKVFSNTSNLKKHINSIHLNLRNYMCEFCVARFKTSSALRVHISCYHTKKEDRVCYSCKVCSKSFLRKVGLKQHESLHADIKSYVCSFEGCEKSFRLKETLTKHENHVHRDIKPFQCIVCQERFSRKTYLDTHMYKHTGIKAFCCEVCGKFFTQKGNLRTHMLIHNKKNNIHRCPECFQTFSFKSNLTKHVQQHVLEENCTYRGVSRYNKNAEKMAADIESTKNMSAVQLQSGRRNDKKIAQTTATRYERTGESKVHSSEGSKLQTVLVTPVSGSVKKGEKNRSIVLIVKQLKSSKNDTKYGEQLERTDVELVDNKKVENESNSISSQFVIPALLNSVTSNPEENNSLHHLTAATEKGNLNKDAVDASKCEVGSNIEKVDLNMEKAVGNTSETCLEENLDIRLETNSLSCSLVSGTFDIVNEGEVGGLVDGDTAVAYIEQSVKTPDTESSNSADCQENESEKVINDISKTKSGIYEIVQTSDSITMSASLLQSPDKISESGIKLPLRTEEMSCIENQSNVSLSDDQFISTSIQNIFALENDYQEIEEEVKPESDILKTEESDCEIKIEIDNPSSASDEINELLNNHEYFDRIYPVLKK